MNGKRRTETTVETHEVWVVRRRSGAAGGAPARCAECDARGGMCTPEEAATLARVSPRVVYRWVEAGRLHFTETGDGALFVCLASLGGGAD